MDSFESALEEFRTLFTNDFFIRWGAQKWNPSSDDSVAAAELHVQLISRVAMHRLSYRAGVEVAALTSVYALFEITRVIATKYPMATTFDKMVWHVLNKEVRPFTAKWHRKAAEGALDALDETDEFRSELTQLQDKLRLFDLALIFLRDKVKQLTDLSIDESCEILEEMKQPVGFGIPLHGDLKEVYDKINLAECFAIRARRQNYGIPISTEAAGLAISGGGIRSSTFALGVLVALSKRNLLPQFDYMSTVSGGGFVGSFITTFLSGNCPNNGLNRDQQPFARLDGESESLRRIRHVSRYLQTSSWERLTLGMAQLYGMIVNIMALSVIPLTVGLIEYWTRTIANAALPPVSLASLCILLIFIGTVLPGFIWRFPKLRRHVDKIYLTSGALLLFITLWWSLTIMHGRVKSLMGSVFDPRALSIAGSLLFLPILFAFFLGIFPIRLKLLRWIITIVAGLAAPLAFISIEMAAFAWLETGSERFSILTLRLQANTVFLIAIIVAIYLLIWRPLSLNFTAPHRHYKNKLSAAFLIRQTPSGLQNFEIPLSGALSAKGPYHLINAALNIPSSKNPSMQGRLTDFFLFSYAYCGSPVLGYFPTSEWERADPGLNVATAMAISGAAASPLMGMATKLQTSFWLALLNIRLGYWAKNPKFIDTKSLPGPMLLGKEMVGLIDENGPYVNLTDGGHIENLGVYELIRRRCKFIVAIDGEFDPQMTFHALTNLQRLASIDLGVNLELDLDDLRLDTKNMSRSHFQLCRIEYPAIGDSVAGIGYLLYVKLSLTGNEGEFLRRYRMDEPDFPHHSTSNQFFSEGQFEAYRSLGEHIGERLFVDALTGSISKDADLVQWFEAMGTRMLRQ